MHHIVSMWNLKHNDTTEFIYKTETDSQILRMNLWLPEEKGVREEYTGSLKSTCMHAMFKTDEQQGEKERAAHSFLLAWEISWTEEPEKSQR